MSIERGKILEVSIVPSGSELRLDAISTDTILWLEDAYAFNEAGGSLTINGATLTYGGADMEANTVTLSAPLGTSAVIGDRVDVWPPGASKWAMVDLDDRDEGIRALVPFNITDKIDDGIRDLGDREDVLVTDETGRWEILALDEEIPMILGDYIDPGSLPTPDLTDGNPPASSPTPTATGLRGSVFLRWTPIVNADPVTYEIHINDTSGFVPTAGGPTKVGETMGSLINVSQYYDGTPLQYEYANADDEIVPGKPYYFRLIAKDADGAAAPGGEATGIMNQAAAGDLAANSVTAVQLASTISLSNLFTTRGLDVNGNPVGQGIDIGATPAGLGIFTYKADGSPEISMPSEGTKVWKGDAEIDYLTVKTLTTLLSTSLSEGAVMTLQSGVVNPTTAPYATIYNSGDGGIGTTGAGDKYGWVLGTGNTYAYTWDKADGRLVKYNADTRAFVASLYLDPIQYGERGQVCIGGGYIWVLIEVTLGSSYRLYRINESTFTEVDDAPLSWGTVTQRPQKLAAIHYSSLISGAHKLYMVFSQTSAGGTAGTIVRVRGSYADVSPTSFSMEFGTAQGGNYAYNYDLAGALELAADFGTTRLVVIRNTVVAGSYGALFTVLDTSSLNRQQAEEWESATGSGIRGFGYHSTKGTFVGFTSDGFLKFYSKVYWKDNTNLNETWYVAFNWRYHNGTSLASETRRGPATTVPIRKRQSVLVSAPATPAGVNGASFFWSRTDPGLPNVGSSDMTRVGIDENPGAPAGQSISYEYSYSSPNALVAPFSAPDDPTANTFGAGTPAAIRSSMSDAYGPLFNLEGDGDARSVSLMPVGAIIEWPHETLPDASWLWADGGTFMQADYPELYVKLGNTTTKPTRADKWLESSAPVTSGVLTASAGYAVNAQSFRRLDNNWVYFDFAIERTGANVVLGNPDHANQQIGTIASDWDPVYAVVFPTNQFRHVQLAGGGAVQALSGIADSSYTNSNINTGMLIGAVGMYKCDPPTAAPRVRFIIKAR